MLDCEGRVVAVVTTLITNDTVSVRYDASFDRVAEPKCRFHTHSGVEGFVPARVSTVARYSYCSKFLRSALAHLFRSLRRT